MHTFFAVVIYADGSYTHVCLGRICVVLVALVKTFFDNLFFKERERNAEIPSELQGCRCSLVREELPLSKHECTSTTVVIVVAVVKVIEKKLTRGFPAIVVRFRTILPRNRT